jgi:hypothetical protein
MQKLQCPLASTYISKENLRGQEMCDKVRVPSDSPQEGDVWNCEDKA